MNMKTILALSFLATVFFLEPVLEAAPTAEGKAAEGKPEISRLDPRGVQRGVEVKIKVFGTNLLGLSEVKFSNEKIKADILDIDEKTTEAWITVLASPDLKRGDYEFSLKNEKGESARVKLFVDDLPQILETASDAVSKLPALPVTFSGTLDPQADRDEIEFEAKAGQTLVFEFSATSIGSKANAMLALFDEKRNLLASNNGFDGADPLVVHKFSKSGIYRLKISDEAMGGSENHFYRLSVGEFPEVVGIFPLSVATNAAAEVELVGYNLPAGARVKFEANKAGEMEVPIDLEKFHVRKAFKVLVTDDSELLEVEPNDSPGQATRISVPGAIGGRLFSQGRDARDNDLFRFEGRAGQVLVVETMAARRGSPIDTRIEILHPDGKPVERVLLQGVRNSNITFRGIDANIQDVRVENWEEMELNELLYMRGEVCKLFRMPQGPDSGFQFYSLNGKRRTYFDTTPTAHADEEACYIVEPHLPGTKLVDNGLPVFPLHYENDDDGERRLGSDSRLVFTVPSNGAYLVRVSDSRGFSGERFAYRLSVREAKPDFKVTLNGANPVVPPGSGQEFSFAAERTDGFEGEIKIDISGLPEGFLASNPLSIQAGHTSASGSIFAATDAKDPAEMPAIKMTATAKVDGKTITKEVNSFAKIKLGEKPKLMVALEPYAEGETNFVERSISEKPLEITIAPGQIIPVWIKIKRSGHDDLVSFTAENLPHGVIVDNIGLSGVLIPKEESERQVFLKAARWVPETERLAHLQAKQAGNPTSLPVLIRVRNPSSNQQVSALK